MQGTVVITGGSRGVGAAIAVLAAERGFDVAINYLKAKERAEEVAAAVKAHGRRAAIVQADVREERGVVELFAAAESALGPISALVNNAGGGLGNWPIDKVTAEHLTEMLALNLTSVVFGAREAARRMAKRHGGQGGTIVNVSSMSAFNGGMPGLATYSAAKGGVESLTVALANELGPEGIRVNCLRFGAIDTEVHDGESPEWRETMLKTIVLKRYGTKLEAAQAALFLLSPESSYITGAVLNVSGGRR
jgi:NAD(P)-dependent dehydrogenase (short-subunit alcohol dehydrogenase family)